MRDKNILKAYNHLNSPDILRRLKLSTEEINSVLEAGNWEARYGELLDKNIVDSSSVLKAMKPMMSMFSEEPEEGWLQYICGETIAYMYPENYPSNFTPKRNVAAKFFLENYRCLLRREHDEFGESATDHLYLLDKEETKGCINESEYKKLRKIWDEHYIFEFMRINREITPFNTLGHIAGVHYVAVFVGRQLVGTGVPVDISLVSGAAAGHDIGKFGCRPEEARRVPYLHYYYTDMFLNRENMPMTAHIASNHSTWDLELENLSIESLLLIYADFRVKSTRVDGVEIVNFYSLDESFQVILDKLDNVDEAKRHRYEKVYAKLKDFENYLKNMGVETDIKNSPATNIGENKKDFALMSGDEVVENIKYTAIEHNIKLMSIFNNESAFGSLIEAARSERQWKNQRAYLDILNEYFTYMTKQEKTITLNFLYDLLAHREGDIRRQAGHLLGTIIANYDDVYRKELPDTADASKIHLNESVSVWEEYMHKIVYPDYKVTDRHRSWIGYAFRSVIDGIFENVTPEEASDYVRKYVDLFRDYESQESSLFTLLNSVTTLPEEVLTPSDREIIIEFAIAAGMSQSVALIIGALRALEHLTRGDISSEAADKILRYIEEDTVEEYTTSVNYMKAKICGNLGNLKKESHYKQLIHKGSKLVNTADDNVSWVVRENLKVKTPWVVKAANIDFLLEYANSARGSNRLYHMATHFSNLIKVSEIVTVRRRAGASLIAIADRLPIEQVNEIVIELTKGLEIGEYQFSKYIPEFLGQLALYLYPGELDEFISAIAELIENNNDKVGSVALDTVGEMIIRYSDYKYADKESAEATMARRDKLLGMLLKGLSNYHEVVSQEAFMVIGKFIFACKELSFEQKLDIFKSIYKKTLTLITSIEEYDMNFFNNAAALNNIYRFISEYNFRYGDMNLPINTRIAFFPGTFDPFSLSHKGTVQSIRDEGFEVYLALDEFSWSKKTQARMLRRKIITMSVADEPDVFMFPDDFPVNIANPGDLKNLKELFPGKQVYMVVGSDVITNASSYRAEATEHSIHSMNHVVFRRESLEQGEEDYKKLLDNYKLIKGDIVELKLPLYLEDISSTKIRDNIDQGRDISTLIDSVAQNFIYDNSLYLREPQYKNILEKSHIKIVPLRNEKHDVLKNLEPELIENGLDINLIRDYIDKDYVNVATVEDVDGNICALAAVNLMETSQLYEEFKDRQIASYLRKKVTGRILVIRGLYCNRRPDMDNVVQMISTEVISQALAEDITYAIYHPVTGGINRHIREIIERMGFTQIVLDDRAEPIFEVNMKAPMAVIQNLDTVLKAPFNTNPRILDVLQKTHGDMLKAIAGLNPGNLVLSFNAGILNQKIVDMVTRANNVPNYPTKPRKLGECMCVPFGKMMHGIAVPNTVTKMLHTEKVYTATLDKFTIEEFPMYATLANQIKTIKSFNRPVILVDDLLHNGHRMQSLDPYFKSNSIEIRKIVTGLLSGNGKDLMDMQGRDVESAYFIPNLKAWFLESAMCPYIGGDGIKTEDKIEANLIPSINQMLPFATMPYLLDCPREAVYNMCKVCLENAMKIFRVLEDEYQEEFERKLTIKRLSDAIIGPRMPNGANRVAVNFNFAPSVYMADYMERLLSLEGALS
ncbi:MAG: hypothetical protein KBS66_02700 [Eubacterium sp.]|nr:hypothetical protein [Candidatus Colimonas fimequi]